MFTGTVTYADGTQVTGRLLLNIEVAKCKFCGKSLPLEDQINHSKSGNIDGVGVSLCSGCLEDKRKVDTFNERNENLV